MREDQTQPPNPNTQVKPPQFGLRAIFVVTAMVAVVAAAIRLAGVVGFLLSAYLIWAIILSVRSLRTKRDVLLGVSIHALVLGLLALILLPPVQVARESPGRNYCPSNLKQIGLALQNYLEKHGRFPPAVVYDANGRPMHSWRTLILPEIEEGRSIHQQYNFDEPWNSPHNSKVTQVQIDCLQCPDDQRAGPFDTSYVALIGPDSIWSGKDGAKGNEVTDGTAQTMIVIEMKNSGIHWAEPRDLDLDALPAKFNKRKLGEMLSPHKHGVITVYADGHVEVIPFDATVEDLKAAVSKSAGDMADFEKQRNRIVPTPTKAKP